MKNAFWAAIIPLLSLCSCQQEPALADHEIACRWADLTLHITKYTPANSPTYASRCLGYVGLVMYEAVVPGFPEYRSLSGQLNGLDSLPQPEPGKAYDWRLSLNAAQAVILKQLYQQTADSNKVMIDSLEAAIFDNLSVRLSDSVDAEASIAFGRAVANRLFEWSLNDGGHRGYLRNFDKKLELPRRPGSWAPPLFAQSFSHHPLHPHWGKNRTFLPANAKVPDPEMIPYDTTASSPYYQQFLAVYNKERELTQEEKEIAIWWGDDPEVTFTPPGHSYHIARLVVLAKKPDLIKSAETFARTGMAVADAFINCWKWKYQFFTERPNTFIPRYIDKHWESFWPDPPFPAFPSGHAIQASAAATVLTALYGPDFEFTDTVHLGRERDEVRKVEFKQRSFSSFQAVAQETAMSRFYGGIHIPHDNAVGLEKGAVIGDNVNGLKWKGIDALQE
jgi:hypothetical protein